MIYQFCQLLLFVAADFLKKLILEKKPALIPYMLVGAFVCTLHTFSSHSLILSSSWNGYLSFNFNILPLKILIAHSSSYCWRVCIRSLLIQTPTYAKLGHGIKKLPILHDAQPVTSFSVFEKLLSSLHLQMKVCFGILFSIYTKMLFSCLLPKRLV